MSSTALQPENQMLVRDREAMAEWEAREGQFHYLSGSYRRAAELLNSAATSFFELHLLSRGIEILITLLRIRAEREEFTEIARVELLLTSALDVATDVPSVVRSRAHYMLGLCDTFKGGVEEEAVSHFEQAIDFAVVAGDRTALAYPLLGLASLHLAAGRLPEMLNQLAKLDTILEVVDIPELRASSAILHGLNARNNGDLDKAIDHFWSAYRLLRRYPNMVLYIQVLHALGTAYARKGDSDFARHYFNLATNAISDEELPRLKRLVESSLNNLPIAGSRPEAVEFDFMVKKAEDTIFDHNGQPLPIQGRFVLKDLAMQMMCNPGRVFTKEEVVRMVWNEEYDPIAHDNKVYVTIRRLRAVLEATSPSRRSPFILRSKAGYHFDQTAKVKIVE